MGKKSDGNGSVATDPVDDALQVDGVLSDSVVGEGEGDVKPANDVPADPLLDGIAAPHESAHDDFDPAIHASDAAGNPVKKADGTFAKKRGRKADSSRAGSALPSPNAPANANVPLIRSDVLSSEQCAKQICNVFLNGAVMIFGEEWQPESQAESRALVYSLRDYFDIRGVPKFPPELGLLIAFGAYALPRISKEKTRSKLDAWKDKARQFFSRI